LHLACPLLQRLVFLQVDQAADDRESLGRLRIKEVGRRALLQQKRGGKRLRRDPDQRGQRRIETAHVLGVGNGRPVVRHRVPDPQPLRPLRRPPPACTPNAVTLTLLLELKLDRALVAAVRDQLVDVLRPVSMLAEKREGDRVEDR
jgi:hypothetical protein